MPPALTNGLCQAFSMEVPLWHPGKLRFKGGELRGSGAETISDRHYGVRVIRKIGILPSSPGYAGSGRPGVIHR